jgi:hypothetical protein
VAQPVSGLTPRSRRGPTASHQARAGGTLYIFTGPGLAACRRSRLNSNVRQRMKRRCPAAPRLGQVASPLRCNARSGQAVSAELLNAVATPPVTRPSATATSACAGSTAGPRLNSNASSPAPQALARVAPRLTILPSLAACSRRCLTPRSRRGPTALHLAREAPWLIMRLAGQAQYRRSRLNSNVRPHTSRNRDAPPL